MEVIRIIFDVGALGAALTAFVPRVSTPERVPVAGTAASTATKALQAVSYAAPLAGPIQVVRAFAPPASQYGPGHLGVDLRSGQQAPVLAAAAGKVRFAGPVAGREVVVLLHADGISTEYEPVRPLVRTGATVRRGQPIGAVTGIHRGCATGCLHWGARRGAAYLDPLGLLGRLGVVRLLPWR